MTSATPSAATVNAENVRSAKEINILYLWIYVSVSELVRALVVDIASVRCVWLHANVVNFRQTRKFVVVVVVCSLSQSTSTRASGAQFSFDQRV